MLLLHEYPFYFSNSFPNDLLYLQNNEMKVAETSFQKNFNIFLPACGDLRQVIQTVHSLPFSFKGNLEFALNDIDPFVTARNVLLLFLMTTCEQEKASSISTIWLSLQLSGEDYSLLQETLKRLVVMDSDMLKKQTEGIIDVGIGCYDNLREVWNEWGKLPCRIGDESCIKVLEERNDIFNASEKIKNTMPSFFDDVPTRHIPSMRKWFHNGIILPTQYSDEELIYFNPTFTGRGKVNARRGQSPSSYKFVYCVRWDCLPYQIWDYLEMVKFHSSDSITEMCHVFTTHVVSKSMNMMRDKRLYFIISCEDFLFLESVTSELDHKAGYDRIFASNLIDYHGIATVVNVLEPYLNETNPYAVLLTETFNWHFEIEGAVWEADKNKLSYDTLKSIPNMKKSSYCAEYYDNTLYFLSYLRGDRLNWTFLPVRRIPKLSEVSICSGLKMRDFRKERNHVVPFFNRVAARPVNVLTGLVRTLEWYRET